MRITVLAGGVGAARFLRGLKAAAPDAEITVIGNTGDDITLFGLHISPDLDTVMYTLGGGISEERGWGRADETFTVLPELAAYGAGPDWFTLGDRDIATHITRTAMLNAGRHAGRLRPSSCASAGRSGVTLLPMSDDRVETHVVLDEDGPEARARCTSRSGGCGCTPPCRPARSWPPAPDQARPAPGVLAAIEAADFVLLPPSNPVVSIGTILAVPQIAAAVRGQDGGRGVPDHRGRAGARHGRRLPDRDRRGHHGHGGGGALRGGPAGRLAGRRAGQGRRRPRPSWPASRCGRCRST